VPRPITAAIPAITLPSPVPNDFTTPVIVSAFAPIATAASPTISDASNSEMNALTLNRVTSRTSAPIAARATRISLRSAGVTARNFARIAVKVTLTSSNERYW
jgi:hypothetical protein